MNPVAISGDTIYATTNGYFSSGMRAFALSVADGAEKWSFPVADAYSVNPPSFSNGRVYFQRCNNGGDTHLWCLDAASGRLVWAAPHEAQWERYKAPTIANGRVFVNGGAYGGMYGFDATTGAQRFFIGDLDQTDGWTPGYAEGLLYTCVDGIFTAYEPVNGTQQWTRNLAATNPGGLYSWAGSVPVLSDGKAAVIGAGRLVVMDLATRTQLWTVAGSFSGTPAFVDGVVYATVDGTVKAYSATNGNLLGTYTGAGTPSSANAQPLVTKDLLLASGLQSTTVFNRATFARLQTLPAGGDLTYAAGRLYIINGAFGSPSTLATYTVAATESDPAPDPLTPPPPPSPRPNPDRPLGAATAVWLDTVKAGGIAYFLFDSPAKIERFDLANGTWLAPISLPIGPKAFAVAASGIYVSFGTSISKFSLDGATETPLSTLAADIRKVFELSGKLYLATASGSNITVLDPATGTTLGIKNFFYGQQGFSVAASKGKFFTRSTGISPADILQTSVSTDGSLGLQRDSPTHGTYPNATRTYLFPGEARVVDNAGIIYSTGDLTYLGSLAGSFDDVDFAADSPVVLRTGNTLVAYSAALAETGRKTIAANQRRIYVGGEFAYSFSFQTSRGAFEIKTPISELVPPAPPTGIDPTAVVYTPDAMEFDGTDVVYILSKLHQSIFRWSVSQRKYLGSIALTDIPQLMSYSAFQQRLYLSYASGRLGKIELTASNIAETAFVNLPEAAATMTAVGDSLFVSVGDGGSWMDSHIYSAAGTLIATRETTYPAAFHVWSPATRRLYFISTFSPNDLHWQEIDTEAKFAQAKDSPYHGDYTMRNPVRISPDGQTVVLGDGGIYEGTSLSRLGALPQAFTDAAWAGGTLYSLRSLIPVGGSQPTSGELKAWSAAYSATATGLCAGVPLRLFGLSDGLLAVSLVSGKPRFTRHALDLTQQSSDPGDNPPLPGGLTPRPNPDRPLAQTNAPWLEATRHGDIAYFLFDTPAKVERYDLQAGAWLSPISLPDHPVAFTVSANGIFVSFGQAVSIFSLDGSTETPLAATATDVRWLQEHAGKLYIGANAGSGTASTHFATIDISNGSVLDSQAFFYSEIGLSFAPTKRKIFGRSTGISPADIMQITLNADGTLNTQTDSPTHGSYPDATRTFVAPGEAWVADNAGIVYSTDNLRYLRSMGGAFDDLAFRDGGEPVLLRGNTLVGFSANILESGRKTIGGAPLRIFTDATDVVSFARIAGRGVIETRTPFSELVPQVTPPPIDPTGIAYAADAIEFDGDDIIYILNKTNRAVFRWSISEEKYLTGIGLTETPALMALSPANGRLYIAYPGGRLTEIPLAAPFVERTFASTPQTATGLAAAGEFIFAVDPSGAWTTHYTFSATGELISSVDWNYYSTEFIWNAQLRKMYFTRDGTSPNDLLWENIGTDGVLGTNQDSPYHGNYSISHPIRVAPDGSEVILGTGDIYHGTTLNRLGVLPMAITDAVWVNGGLFVLQYTGPIQNQIVEGTGAIKAIDASRAVIDSVAFAGTPRRLFSDGEILVALVTRNGKLTFQKFNLSLDSPDAPPPPPPPPPPSGLDFTKLKGTYYGALIGDPTGQGPRGGALTLQLSANGSATGTVQLPTGRYSFVTRFDDEGHAVVKVFLSRFAYGWLTLDLAAIGDSAELTGAFARGNWSMAFTAAPLTGELPIGKFLFALTQASSTLQPDVPPFAGTGSLVVAAKGTVRVSVKLITGESLTQGGWLGANGSISIYLPSRRGADLLEGNVRFEDLPASDWTGDLQWLRSAAPRATRYSSGIATQLKFNAAAYHPAAPAFGVFGDAPATVLLYGGNVPGYSAPVTLQEKGTIVTGAIPPSARLRVNRATGVLSGSFKHPLTGRATAVNGVVNQKAMTGTAGFLGTSQAGRVDLGSAGSLSLPANAGSSPMTTTTTSATRTIVNGIYSGSLNISSGGFIKAGQGTLELRPSPYTGPVSVP